MSNNNNISILSHCDCCGCRACGDACPVGCISFVEDNEGFMYPLVDENKCISCGKCQRICPEMNLLVNPKAQTSEAAYAKKTQARNAGSSGGIFGLLSEEILSRGGHVYGAAFTDNLKLVHKCAATISGLQPLLRSKYLQSNTSGCFDAVVSDIRAGIPVLFSGTPCQCNAVRNIVGSNCENLITVEVVCHGVPSQSLFDKSISWVEKKRHCTIKSFTFRSKHKKALNPQAFTYVCTSNGKRRIVNGLHYQFPFYFGFQKYITLRPSCYRCKWARPERTADITLGDFWGIEEYFPELNAKNGVSEVIVNTEKGRNLFETLCAKGLLWHQSLPVSAAIKNNGCLQAPTQMKPEREAFFDALESEPFDVVVQDFLKSKREWIFKLYYGMPGFLRRVVRKLMDKRMKYE